MSMTAGKSTSLFCCYFSICVCAYPHLSVWSFYVEFEADNHKMVYTIRATGTSHIRTVPNYNHVATTYAAADPGGGHSGHVPPPPPPHI